MTKDYDVGYGKPPQHSRFQKGRSGNPAGRPKGATNPQSEMKRLLGKKTKIKFNGVVRTVTNLSAACLSMLQKAKAGDVRAFSKVVEVAGPDMADELKALSTALVETDIDIIKRALERESQRTPNAQEPTVTSKEDKT